MTTALRAGLLLTTMLPVLACSGASHDAGDAATGDDASEASDVGTSADGSGDAAADAGAGMDAGLDATSPTDSGAKHDGSLANDASPPDGATGDAAPSGDGGSSFPPCPQPLTPSAPLTINGASGMVVRGVKIASTTGDCITITNSTHITIAASEIGPCGGNGISVSGSMGVTIVDDYVHPESTTTGCCDTNDGILVQSGSSNVLLQGNVVAYGESNIELPTTTSSVQIIGNFLLNPLGPFPRGQQVQAWHATDVTVQNNYGLSSTSSMYAYPENQEDAFNFGFTSGTVVAKGNYITGGHSVSGCGLIADEAANGCQFEDNTLLDTGQCGIGVASGTNVTVDGNRVLDTTPVDGGGNTGIYVWSQYSDPCGPTTVTNNVACQLKPDGTQSGYWNGGGCDPTTDTNDTWDTTAQMELSPPSQKMPPPAIPPQPYACVAPSPF